MKTNEEATVMSILRLVHVAETTTIHYNEETVVWDMTPAP